MTSTDDKPTASHSTPDTLGDSVESDLRTMAAHHSTLYVCTACGTCCTWHGYVRMTDAEIDRMAAYIGMTPDAFIQTHMTVTGDRRGLTLTEESNGHCIFLEPPNRCTVYPVRPKQCRDFPNKWNFPGFRRECPSVPVRYRKTSPDSSACAAGYFPQKKLFRIS